MLPSHPIAESQRIPREVSHGRLMRRVRRAAAPQATVVVSQHRELLRERRVEDRWFAAEVTSRPVHNEERRALADHLVLQCDVIQVCSRHGILLA